MANIFQKDKFNCFKGMKSCIQSIKNSDYEIVTYTLQPNGQPDAQQSVKQPKPELKRNACHSSIKSKSTTNILSEADQQCFEFKKQKARVNLMQQFKHADNNPKFQSTQLEQTRLSTDNDHATDSLYFSTLEASNPNKIASTMINKSSQFYLTVDLSQSQVAVDAELSTPAFSNESYYSPIVTRSVSQASFQTDYKSLASQSSDYHSVKSFFQSTQYDSVAVSSGSDQLYVCIVPYKAKFQGDITSLDYAERVKLVHVNNESSLSLVQNISTNECGYIPTNCIMLLASFLNQL